MDDISALIVDIEHYCQKAEISESTFGRQVVNDGKFVSRIRGGKGVTLKTLTRVREYMRIHSPGPDSISEKEAALELAEENQPIAAKPLQILEEKANKKLLDNVRRPFRFYENRQKYLTFVHTCNEKWAISQRAGLELKNIQPHFPALRIFDAGMGDGTLLSYLIQNMHRQFPMVPFFVNAKEMSLEDVRLGLAKLPDRLCEHPASVYVINNLHYDESPWLSPRQQHNINWQVVALEGNCAHEYGEQIEALHSELSDNWQTLPSEKTGNPLYQKPSVLVIYRADHQFMLEPLIPEPGPIVGDYDFVLASQPWQARVSAEFKVKRILAPLVQSLREGGRLLGVQSYGDDPALEIVQGVWPDENPFSVNRHVLVQVLKEYLGPESRKFHFNTMSDSKSVFRYAMHTLPTEIGDHIGSSTLLAAWNAAIYVNQIEDNQLAAAMASDHYLQVTEAILKKRKELWFNDETFVVTRRKSS